jgi:hypothetical protein
MLLRLLKKKITLIVVRAAIIKEYVTKGFANALKDTKGSFVKPIYVLKTVPW